MAVLTLSAGIRVCVRFRIKADVLEEAVEATKKPSQEREGYGGIAAGGQRIKTHPRDWGRFPGARLSVAPFDRCRNALIERGAFSAIASRLLGLRHCLPKPECGG